MFKTAIIVAIFLVLTNGDNNPSSEEEDCVCVAPQFCKGYTEGATIIHMRTILNEDETEECGTRLKTCCHKDDVIPHTEIDKTEYSGAIQQECGGRNVKGAIFTLADENLESQFGEFPWMIEISYKPQRQILTKPSYRYLAGGSLIRPSVVLTAAHKVHDKDISTLRIRAGEWDQNSNNEPLVHQDRRVIRMVKHEQFHAGIGSNSVALLFLDEPFQIRKHINTVCLPPADTSFDHARCFVAGWGTDARTNGTTKVNILKKIDLPVVPHDECQNMLKKSSFGDRFRLSKNLLCAGGEEGKDSCNGDGGSPLVCPIPNVKDGFYQAGIVVSSVGNCGAAEEPALYAKITNYVDWINSHIAEY